MHTYDDAHAAHIADSEHIMRMKAKQELTRIFHLTYPHLRDDEQALEDYVKEQLDAYLQDQAAHA